MCSFHKLHKTDALGCLGPQMYWAQCLIKSALQYGLYGMLTNDCLVDAFHESESMLFGDIVAGSIKLPITGLSCT